MACFCIARALIRAAAAARRCSEGVKTRGVISIGELEAGEKGLIAEDAVVVVVGAKDILFTDPPSDREADEPEARLSEPRRVPKETFEEDDEEEEEEFDGREEN